MRPLVTTRSPRLLAAVQEPRVKLTAPAVLALAAILSMLRRLIKLYVRLFDRLFTLISVSFSIRLTLNKEFRFILINITGIEANCMFLNALVKGKTGFFNDLKRCCSK